MIPPDPHIGDPVLGRHQTLGCIGWLVALIVVVYAVGLWLGTL